RASRRADRPRTDRSSGGRPRPGADSAQPTSPRVAAARRGGAARRAPGRCGGRDGTARMPAGGRKRVHRHQRRRSRVRARGRGGDAVVGVSASGRTAYVLAAMKEARAKGAMVVGFSCATNTPLGELADVAIEIETGPEVIAGSTRLKSGTVQKVVLNMISTGVFVRLGHTYRGRMTGV